MITDAILDLVFVIAGWFIDLTPEFPIPAWMTTTLPGWISTIAGWFSNVAYWLPVGHFSVVLGFAVGLVGLALGVRLVRIVLSFLTAGGGSAA